MRTVTLLQLRTDIAYQADIVTGTTGRYTTAMLNRFINQSIQRFRERISNEGIQHYLVSASGTIAAGASSGVPFATLDLSSLSPSLVRTYGLDITYQNVAYTLTHRPFTERAIWSGPQVTGMPQSWAHFRTDQLAVTPAPDQAYPYTVWYLPLLADLSSDSDTFDGVAGWEDFIVWDVTCRVINRDQYANAYAIAVAERDRVWEDILRSATKVSAAGGAVVGRDTFNDTSKRFPIRRIQPGGGGLPSDGTITNAMLATMSPSRIKGRAADAGVGAVQDLTPAQVAAIVPVFSGAAAGLVPTGTGSSTDALRGDGTWAPVSGGGGGGGGGGTVGAPTLSFQFNNGSGIQAGATGVKVAGSGVGINAVALTVASLSAPIFSGTQAGLVPTATSAGLFLRDDATWAGIPSNIATGIGVSQMLPAPPLTFRGRITLGSGPLEYVTVRQAASMLPLFAASGVGQGLLAAPTGGVSGKWLRDDGTWQAIPTSAATGVGAGPTMLAAGASGQLQYNGGSGFAGATGLGVIGGGLGLNAVGITVASLSAPVFGARAGLVPTSSSAGLFLKDDGTWATPAGGGGGGGSPGAPTNAIQYNAGSGVFGGATGFQYFVGSGMVAWEGARFPSGMLAFGGTGTSQVPQLYMGNPSGGGFFFALGNPALETIRIAERTASPNLVTYVRDQGGIGTPRVVEAIDRNPSGSVDRYFGDFNDVRDTLRRTNRFLQDQITVPTGRYQLQIGPNLAPAKSSWAHGHVWNASGTPAAQLNQERLSAQGLGLYSQAFATGLGDALAGWTSSGFANSATGFSIVGSGLGLQGVGLTVASLSAPLFAGSRAGLVPTASSAGLFLKDDGSWASPTVGGSVTGVSNAQLAQSPPFTLKGNASGVTGTVQDLTTQQVASLLGLVSIPSSTPAGLFLRDDGVFAGVPSNIPTGIGPSQMLPMPPLTFRARLTTGSGVPENITNFQAASMLPLFTASGTSMGLVYGPTGGTTGKFLKDDGTWATPAAGSASGIANNQLLPMPPLTIKGNNTGASAAPSDLTRGQVASLIGPFYGTGGSPGLVTTPTGGASGLFLKDNGSWEDLRRNIIQDGNIGSGVTVGSATIDFNQGQYHSATIFGQPQFNIRPPSGIHRHVQLSWTVGASGLKPTFFGTMVKWMGGSGNIPSWNTASGGVNFVTFFHDGTYMWANGADWGTTF